MASYSKTSQDRLKTCHQDLQVLFHYVIQGFDNSILHGQRTPEYQFELFRKGRKKVNGIWVIHEKKKVVTYCDGYEKLSEHNKGPLSHAVDATPYPINWTDMNTIRNFAGYVKGWADALKKYGDISHNIIWGGDWDDDDDFHDQTFMDLFHYEIR